GLEHELGDVHVGRALMSAHLAVDTQVRDLTNFVGRKQTCVGLFEEQMAHQVGLGPRRRGLGVGGMEDWTHSLRRRVASAGAAAIATDGLAPQFTGLPAQRAGSSSCNCRWIALTILWFRKGAGSVRAYAAPQRPSRHARRR